MERPSESVVDSLQGLSELVTASDDSLLEGGDGWSLADYLADEKPSRAEKTRP